VIEPGHFRFTVQGEMIVRLEQRLGYAHKGTLSLMAGRSPRVAARFAARLSGDSTVAHALAFALAAEAAAEHQVPPRAVALRAAMLEIERIANHLNDWGFICNDAAFAWPHARCGVLREGVLRASEAAFGHRLLMDRVIPGGIALDIADGGAAAILAALDAAESREEGDVDARVRVRVAELRENIGLVRRLLAAPEPGEIHLPLPQRGGEGIGVAEGFRGEVVTWMSLDDGGLIRACFPRDPSWLQWPLLEAAVEGNIVADFPLCNKSFNCSYSGVDL